MLAEGGARGFDDAALFRVDGRTVDKDLAVVAGRKQEVGMRMDDNVSDFALVVVAEDGDEVGGDEVPNKDLAVDGRSKEVALVGRDAHEVRVGVKLGVGKLSHRGEGEGIRRA